MGVPFMRAYAERLVRTCHRRGAQAIGGMAAFIPSRRDEAVNRKAMAKVEEDKQREARQGFDGTWVAHPDLVSLARQAFESGLGPGSGQSGAMVDDDTSQLLDVRVPGGTVTEHGVRTNVRVAIEYLAAWLAASGAVGIDNLMEDTATAEISRGQLWQWRRHGVPVDGGAPLTRARYEALRTEILEPLRSRDEGHWMGAAELLDELVLSDTFFDFLTLPGARYLDEASQDN
jgi:malate synthase